MKILPIHDLIIGNSAQSDGHAYFAADGRLYADAVDNVLNLWNVVAYQWSEVLGGLVGLILVVVLVIAIRVWRRPRVAGEMYCRRCAYNLRGLSAGAVCPECGTDSTKRRPVRGRTRTRRLVWPAGVALLACLGYGAMFAAGVGRKNGAAGLFRWRAMALGEWATAQRIGWLEKHIGPERSLYEIDPASGKVLRRVCHLAFASAFPISFGPDGKTAVTTLDEGELAAIDLHSGRVVRSVARLDGGNRPGISFYGASWRHVAGWLDRDTVCAQFLDPEARTNRLYRWNVRSGEMTKIFWVPVPGSAGGPGGVAARTNHLIPSSDPPALFEVVDRHAEGLKYGEQSAIGVRRLEGGAGVEREFREQFWAGCEPVSRGDGAAFYVRMCGLSDIVCLSTVNGSIIESIQAPGFMGTLQEGPAGLAYHDATGRLFVATTGPCAVHVRDVAGKKWIGRLEFGLDALPDDWIAISPDGRWVATRVTAVSVQRMSFKGHLLIFDLSKLDAVAEKSSE